MVGCCLVDRFELPRFYGVSGPAHRNQTTLPCWWSDGLGWCVTDWLTHDSDSTRHIKYVFFEKQTPVLICGSDQAERLPSRPLDTGSVWSRLRLTDVRFGVSGNPV